MPKTADCPRVDTMLAADGPSLYMSHGVMDVGKQKGRGQVMQALGPQDALVAIMIATSAADENISTLELRTIIATVELLPVFEGYDKDRISRVSALIAELFTDEDGLDALIGLVREALPENLHETAYALACDISASDGRLNMTELRLLEMLRHELPVERLHAAAIERGARARHQHL